MGVILVDYFKIGQKIRKYRKSLGLSQEQLAEQAGISVTHMSHIETGNTKLSLPVFVALARALNVQTDDLLTDIPDGRSIALHEVADILGTCTTKQVRIIADLVKAVKIILDKHED